MTRSKSCGEYAGTHAGVNRHRKAWEPLVKVRAKAAKQGELAAMKASPPPPDVAAIVRYLAETRPELLRDALASVEPKEEVRQ